MRRPALVAFSSVDGGDCVPGHTSLYREVVSSRDACERGPSDFPRTTRARRRRGRRRAREGVRARISRASRALASCLQGSDDLVSAETAVLAWEGVRAASSAAKSGDADALAAAAETATRLETALSRVRDPGDPGRAAPDQRSARRGRGRTRAFDTGGGAGCAPRRRARSAPPRRSAGRVHPPERKRPETNTSGNKNVPRRRAPSASFSRLAPRLAETCGRWSRAHAAMGAELRGRNPSSHTRRELVPRAATTTTRKTSTRIPTTRRRRVSETHPNPNPRVRLRAGRGARRRRAES